MTPAATYDLTRFALGDMTRCGMVLRRCGDDAASMEEVAERIVGHFHDQLRDPDGTRQCVLVRLFKTHAHGDLPPPLQACARDAQDDAEVSPGMRCLTLLASAGQRPEWNSRHTSAGHRALPLAGAQSLGRLPMVAALIRDLGVEISDLVEPSTAIVVASQPRAYSVFYVPEAAGSPTIYAQDEFVVPYGVRSVVGFGGLLPGGDLVVTLLFARVPIPAETAAMFATVALSAELAVLPFVDRQTFRPAAPDCG